MPRICYGLRQDGRHDVGGCNFWGMIQHWLAACAVLAGILIACSFAATRLFFAAIRLAVSSASYCPFLCSEVDFSLSMKAHYTYVLVYYLVYAVATTWSLT